MSNPPSVRRLRIVAGLGNPGREHAATRHNIGFMVVDALARRYAHVHWRSKFGAESLTAMDEGIILVKPMEFMNDSGPPLQATARFYRVAPADMLVISDDLDLPLGKLRMRPHGGHGGHNGLRSIIESMGSLFPRLRIGIGRHARGGDAVIQRVLSNFETDEQASLTRIIAAAADGALLWAEQGNDAAMRSLNVWQLESGATESETV